MNILINITLYQIIWFVCVLYGNPGGLIGLGGLALHLIFSRHRAADGKIIVSFLVAGLVIDSAMQLAGVLAFPGQSWPIPFWLAVIWGGLATLPLHSLRWMQGRHVVNIMFGGMGGPLAYWAGVKMGAAVFPQSQILSLVSLAVVWALFWPMAMHFCARIGAASPSLDRIAGKE